MHITYTEKKVLTLVTQGKSNSTIAKELFISPHTVKAHLENIFSKLNVHNRVQASVYAIKYRII